MVDRRLLVILLLIFVFPVGYYALYKNRRMGRISKTLVGGFFAFVIIGVLGSDGTENTQPPASELQAPEQTTPAQKETPAEEETPPEQAEPAPETEPAPQPAPEPQTTEEASPPEESSPQDDGRVTMAEYKQIETGMSYAEVRKIIGSEGEEMSRNEIGGNVTVMYQWVNPFGSNMNAIFQNGGLVQKSQFNLD